MTSEPDDPAFVDVSRRGLVAMAGLGLAAHGSAATGQARRAPGGQTRNVRDFGAKGDGVTDDTEAFNRATRADDEWSWDLLSSIIVPAGRYRIAGTVFLRKGQSLIGEGLSTYIDAAGAKRSTFIMGRRRDGQRGIEDPGGLPVRLESLMGLGGAPDQGFIFAAIPGFQISALFLTAVGLGIEIEAADGIISDIEIDQCLTAFLLRNSQNVVLSNLNLYLANYGITFADRCRDIAVVNSVFCYTKYAAILLGDGGREINSVTITGCGFTNNIAYPTFEGYIYSRASASDVLVSGCSFRNAPTYAINQGAGADLTMSVQGCVFDGGRTNAVYDQSSSPKGLHLRHGRFLVSSCIFRRMPSEAVRITAGAGSLDLEGGRIDQLPGGAIVVSGEQAFSISVRDVQGLGTVTSSGGDHLLSLPWLGPRTRWRATILSNDADAEIGAMQMMIAGGRSGLDAEPIWTTGARTDETFRQTQLRPERRGNDLTLRLPARLFGATAPRIELVGSA